jgi:hypothetical protein
MNTPKDYRHCKPISALRHHFSEHSREKNQSEIQKNYDASVHAEEA